MNHIYRYLAFLLVLLYTAFSPAALATTQDSIHTFLSIADIHFDPFLACHHTRPCPLIQKLQQAPASQWEALLKKYDKTPAKAKEDTPYPLLAAILEKAHADGEENAIQFVLVLGDSLAHHFKDKYVFYTHDKTASGVAAFAKKTLQFTAQALEKAFPNYSIYHTVGNNDSYVENYYTIPQGKF